MIAGARYATAANTPPQGAPRQAPKTQAPTRQAPRQARLHPLSTSGGTPYGGWKTHVDLRSPPDPPLSRGAIRGVGVAGRVFWTDVTSCATPAQRPRKTPAQDMHAVEASTRSVRKTCTGCSTRKWQKVPVLCMKGACLVHVSGPVNRCMSCGHVAGTLAFPPSAFTRHAPLRSAQASPGKGSPGKDRHLLAVGLPCQDQHQNRRFGEDR